jgi:hypothetical protein
MVPSYLRRWCILAAEDVVHPGSLALQAGVASAVLTWTVCSSPAGRADLLTS